MAGDTANADCLSAVLTADELSSVVETVKQKLEGVLKGKDTSLDSLKAQLERERVNSEQRYFELEKRLISTSTKVETESGKCRELTEQKAELEERLKASDGKLAFNVQNREDNTAQTQQLTRVNKQLEAEKDDLITVVNRKDQEIKRLNEEWQSMSEKLSTATTAKCEIQVKLDEIQSQDVSVKYREKRLEQEKQLLTSQNEWLSTELKNKTSELLSVRKEKSNQILELQGQLNSKSDEVTHLQDTVDSLKKTHDDQNERIERLVKKIQENHESMAKSEEQFQSEVQAQSKLANLYKTSADEAEGKVKELITAVEELQKLLKQATEAQAELEKKVQEMEIDHGQKEHELSEKITKLERELEDANDLIIAARRKGVAPISEQELTALSPTAAAASSFLKSGMTLTQMYSEYVKASDELQLEQQENQRLNHYLDQILQEIEEKAPIMQKQRENYEKSLETNNQLSIRLDSVLLECEQLRVTSDESDRKVNHYVRENQRMKQQSADLGQQVRVLLKEVQEARGGPIGPERDEADVSSSDISSSSQVISEHLVTFRSIEELQKQNEQLLTAIRDLSDKQEQQEKETVETKTSELRKQLESALEDLDQMRTARARQTEMVESIVRQRDMYRVLLEQGGFAPPNVHATVSTSPLLSPEKQTPVSVGVQRSPSIAPADSSLEDTKMALKTLQTEYDTYKKEKEENARMLNEQIEKLQQELSDFRVQNAKLASQLDFSGERFKTLQSNVEGYKKEIAGMRDKSHKLSSEIVQLQQTSSSLTQDLAAAQERCAKAEVCCENLRAERDLLKGVEVRLNQEKESLMREQRGQSLLLTNLQTIQNNLQRSEFETKARLTNQLETMERELTVLRRRLEGDNDQHRTVLKSWEGKVQELQRQLNHELDNHQKTREELNKCKSDLQNMKQQCSGVEAQLVAAQIKLESAVREKNEAVTEGRKKTVVSSSGHEEEIRELRVTIRRKDDEIKGLNNQIVKAKQHAEQYKSISTAIEESLKEQNAASQTFKTSMEKRLQEAIQAKEQLEKQVRELEKERDEVKSESTHQNRAMGSQTAELRRTVSRLQDELKDAIDRKLECEAMEMASRQDSQEQARIAKEAQDKFEREFLLHAADVKQLVTVKEQLSSHNTKLAEAEDRAKKAQDTLASSKASWEEQLRIQKQEVGQLTKRCRELDEQNKVLHEQLQSLSKRMISEQSRPQDAPDGGVLPSEKNKTADQLLEVIKFLRREKEIAESRFELAQAESVRLQQKCEHLEKQLEEVQQNLSGERERSQVLVQTSTQHQELMKKVETLNVLSDSNRMLREEKDRLQQQVHQLEAKVHQLEKDIMPLQEQNREISAQRDALTAEKASLAYDVNRWKQRTDHLMQQYNRADPEEQKKLMAEKEANKKTISNLNEENLRHKAEISRMNAQLSNAKTEISKLNNSLTSVQSQMKMEMNRLREELNTVKREIVTKDKDIDEKGKTINQVKKIGRRYKSQFEETKTKLDELEKQMASEKAAPPQPDPVTVAKVAELEQKVQALTEETTKLKETEAAMRKQMTEKDEKQEKSNKVLQGAKQKITQLIAERDKQQSEADELRGQVSAMEAISSSKDTQVVNQRRESEARITELEKQLEASKSQQAKQQENQTEQQQKQQGQNEEMAQLRTKMQEQQKQIEELQKQLLQQQHLQPMGADRPSSSREEPPPTANIKPIASPATAVSKSSPHTSGARVTASIRPIAVTPSTTTSVTMATTPTATVMPQASNVPSDQDVGDQSQADTPILAIATATPIQAVPPTQQTPPMAVAEPIVESEPSQEGVTNVEELGQAEEQVTEPESAPSTSSSQPSASESTPVAPVEPAPVATKRPRDDTSDGDGSSAEREEKRQRVTPQPPPIDQSKEQESLQQQAPAAPQQQTAAAAVKELLETQGTSAEQTSSADEGQQQFQQQLAASDTNPADTEPSDDQGGDQQEEGGERPEEEEEVVIVISEDEAGGEEAEEGDDEDEEEEDEEEEEEEEYEHEEGTEDYEDVEGFQAGPVEYEEGEEDEEMDEEDEEEGDEDDPEDEEEMEGEEDAEGDDQTMEDEEEDDSDDVVVIDSDEDQGDAATQMDIQNTEQEEQPQPMQEQQLRRVAPPQLRVDPPEQAQAPSQETPLQVPMQQRMGGRTRERLPSLGRPIFSLTSGVGAVPFEDIGDHDCQVPSTPTLFVPPRTDGFAEAINSPLVQRQFQFGAEADRSRGTMTGLAQLATQGDLGMDDTRINLLGGDEEGGRSVPTTPLQTQAPVTMLSASPSAPSPSDMSQSVPVTATETTQYGETAAGSDEPDTLPSEVPQTRPQGTEQAETTPAEQERSTAATEKSEPSVSTPEGGDNESGTAQDIPGGSAAEPGTSAAGGTGEDTAGTSTESDLVQPSPFLAHRNLLSAQGAGEPKQKPFKRIVWGEQQGQGSEQQRQVQPQARGVPPTSHGGPTRGSLQGRGGQQRGAPQGGRGSRGGRYIQRTYPRGGRARGGMNYARRGGQGY